MMILLLSPLLVWYGIIFPYKKYKYNSELIYVILKTAGFALLSKYLQSMAGFPRGIPGYKVIRMHINTKYSNKKY